MPNEFLSLLDITKRRGNDAAVGLIEEVVTYAPEFSVVMGRPIPGISYLAKVRGELTSNAAFRNVGEGVALSAAKYSQKRFDCFYFDAQMQVDQAVLDAANQQGDSEGDVLADEASSVTQAQVIAFGKQFYKGTANDAKGFPGLINFLNTNLVVDATGTGGTTYRAWFVRMDLKGIHFIFGGEKGLDIGQWTKQQVADPNDATKRFMAQVNNLAGYVGLSNAHSQSVGCIKNITAAKPLTDALAEELVAKFPVGMKPNICFVERNSNFYLQKSRSVVISANTTNITAARNGSATTNGRDVFAPPPTEVAGARVIVTDSILSEAAS